MSGTSGSALRCAREAAGLTQTQLADAIGVSSQSINNWEADRYKIPVAYKTILKSALGNIDGIEFSARRDVNSRNTSGKTSLATARIAKNMTQTELANIIGVDNSKISVWEHGGKIPKRHVQQIIDILGSNALSDRNIRENLPKGQVLADLREKANITRAEFARRVGVASATTIDWERGEGVPERFSDLAAKALGCALQDIPIAASKRVGIDLTGQRFGKLVALEPTPKRYYTGSVIWKLRCDCGQECEFPASELRTGKRKSCGKCPKVMPPREPNQEQRTCPVCGKSFIAYPSDPNVTCSPECRVIWTQERHTAKRNLWSEESRQALRERERPEQLKHGTEASLSLPGGQRGETNREAKVWELVSPGGETFTVTNLLHWSRENAWRFGMGEDEAKKIKAGFTAITRSMRGLTRSPVKSYKGWGLNSLPRIPGLDPQMERLSYPVFVKLRSMAHKYPHTDAAVSLFARDVGCEECASVLEVLQMILDCADGGLPNIRGVSGLTREEFADRYSLPLKSVAQWETDPKGITAWAERMLAYVVIVDRMQKVKPKKEPPAG